jgi:hypothetical protein
MIIIQVIPDRGSFKDHERQVYVATKEGMQQGPAITAGMAQQRRVERIDYNDNIPKTNERTKTNSSMSIGNRSGHQTRTWKLDVSAVRGMVVVVGVQEWLMGKDDSVSGILTSF